MEIIETKSIHTFYTNANDDVKITCPECGTSKSFDAGEYVTVNRGVKARCTCGHVFRCVIEFRKSYRKTVNFNGEYRNKKNGEVGSMTVESISLGGIAFISHTPGNLIMKHDILEVSFHLDDNNKTFIQRDVKVTASNDNSISAAFSRSQMYDKDLGFYLMP
jgi:hypothetical protein